MNFAEFNAELGIEIEKYLVNYCSDSLHNLTLIDALTPQKIPFLGLQKPFKNIRAIKIYAGDDFILTANRFRLTIENIFPHVKRIVIEESLSFLHTEQSVSCVPIVHYENVEFFTIYTEHMPLTKYPFSFGVLTQLNIKICYLNDAFYEFIGGLNHLKILKIKFIYKHKNFETSDSFCKLLNLQNIQTNIEELSICYRRLMLPDDIVHFLKQSRRLRKLSFYRHKASKHYRDMCKTMESVSYKLDAEWAIHIMDPYKCPFYLLQSEGKCYVIERVNN